MKSEDLDDDSLETSNFESADEIGPLHSNLKIPEKEEENIPYEMRKTIMQRLRSYFDVNPNLRHESIQKYEQLRKGLKT